MHTPSHRYTTLILTVLVLGAAPVAAVAQDDVQVHLFASQGFAKSTATNDFVITGTGEGTFDFNEFGFNLQKQVTPKLRFGIQVFAQGRGDFGKDQPTIDWAFADYRFRDYVGIRVGKVKMPLGLYNETRDTDSLRTFLLLPQGVYSDRQRESTIAQTGAALYGTLPMKSLGSLAYQAHVGALAITSNGGVAQDFEAKVPVLVTDASPERTYVGSLDWNTPVEGLRLAVTRFKTTFDFATTTTPAASSLGLPPGLTLPLNNEVQRTYCGVEYTFHDLVIASEYMREDVRALLATLPILQNDDTYYVSGSYRLSKIVEVGAYYNASYEDRFHRDAGPSNFLKDGAATLRLDLNRYWTLKAEVHQIHGYWHIMQATTAPVAPDTTLFAIKTTVSF